MYGHHDYSLNLEIVQAKRDKEVRTKYHTSCTLGGYHTLANVVDFAQKTKTIYSKAVQALQKGYTKEITDIFNPDKVWVVKRTADGHYYLNQKIKGVLFYSKFQRVTRNYLKSINVNI
jgi:hypothetical protein